MSDAFAEPDQNMLQGEDLHPDDSLSNGSSEGSHVAGVGAFHQQGLRGQAGSTSYAYHDEAKHGSQLDRSLPPYEGLRFDDAGASMAFAEVDNVLPGIEDRHQNRLIGPQSSWSWAGVPNATSENGFNSGARSPAAPPGSDNENGADNHSMMMNSEGEVESLQDRIATDFDGESDRHLDVYRHEVGDEQRDQGGLGWSDADDEYRDVQHVEHVSVHSASDPKDEAQVVDIKLDEHDSAMSTSNR